ncbi:MAG: ABC transporter ATP-binding protein [Veillonellaceae bacterium]|nr:ABC transporter ATP-binding protein [Veillonellaceae bacterium]
MSDIAIQISNLSKAYKIFDKPTDRIKESLNPFGKRYSKDFYALHNVSVSIYKGETIGVIGKNGAGKSTLLKMITGVLTPSSGNITINGRIASLLELGAGFNPEMTGIENIYFNGTIMGYTKKEIDAKLDDILDFADIGDFIHQPVKMYSSGMFARLAFAVNVNVKPDILIVDEALSVGDVFFQNKCFKRMADLQKQGVTVLFVSHDMGSIRQLCSKCLWLDNGTKRQYGPVEEVAAAYFNEQLAERNQLHKEAVKQPQEVDRGIQPVLTEKQMILPRLAPCQGFFNKDVVIQSFVFLENGCQAAILEDGHTYEAVMAVEFHKAFDKLIYGFVVENNKGIAVIGVNSWMTSQGKTINVDSPGTILARFTFTMPKIMQGSYTVSPAVAQGTASEHIQLTWLENALLVDVQNSGYNYSILEIDNTLKIEKYQNSFISYLERDIS